MSINIDDVKKIAERYGRNDIIAEKLGLTYEQFCYVNYYHYCIVDEELRKWAYDFASAVQAGKALYKLEKIEELSDVETRDFLSDIEKRYERMRVKRDKDNSSQRSFFD